MTNPSDVHFQQIDRVIQFLYATRYYAFEYSTENWVEAFLCASDAAFADNPDRKSSEGYLCKLFGAAIDWKASKQATITTSTTEAELLAISQAGKSL